jgi:hypothetical protein
MPLPFEPQERGGRRPRFAGLDQKAPDDEAGRLPKIGEVLVRCAEGGAAVSVPARVRRAAAGPGGEKSADAARREDEKTMKFPILEAEEAGKA